MTRRRAYTAPTLERVSWMERWIQRVLRLPRWARLLIAIFNALCTTALVFPAMDYYYLTYWFDFNTRNLPSLVTAGVGILAYFVGWYVLVRQRSEPEMSSRAVRIYLAAATLIVAATAGLMLYGLISALIQ